MSRSPVTPRPASTLILVRDTASGPEVFLMQRSLEARFMPGVFVFPGGRVDAGDADPLLAACCRGLDEAAANRRLGLENGALPYWTAAIRECYEEAGLLLACAGEASYIRLDQHPRAADFARQRLRLAQGELGLAQLCSEHGLSLALDRLAYFDHWITPADLPQRFDTRFFVALAPEGQTAQHDQGETIDHLWISPVAALQRNREGQFQLANATISCLQRLAGFGTAAELLAHAHARQEIAPVQPRAALFRGQRKVLLPSDHAYAEVGKLAPAGTLSASGEIQPGIPVQLSERVVRVTAPNPSFMTGPGTNSYLVGQGDELAVIDPGPAMPDHVDTLLRVAGGRIRWILSTHTHLDHSPAVQALKAATGATVLGWPAPAGARQDHTFAPDRAPRHGERLQVGDATLRVIHTPGHASNHLCYLLEQENLLFTGDHIMQGSTVVINPPDGDMSAYFASLRALQEEPLEWLAPGHGFLMDRPRERIGQLLAHRQAREDKVLAALRQSGGGELGELVALVYDDVPLNRHMAASRSLLAHLLKLQAEGRALEQDGRWRLAAV